MQFEKNTSIAHKQLRALVDKLINMGIPKAKIARVMGISRQTFYNFITNKNTMRIKDVKTAIKNINKFIDELPDYYIGGFNND